MVFNIIIKNTANIVFDEDKQFFLVRYTTENLTESSINKIIEIFNQLVKKPVSFINDIRSIHSFRKDIRHFIRSQLNDQFLKNIILVTDNTLNKLIPTYLFSLSNAFKTQGKVKIFSSIEDALNQSNNYTSL
jgi:uncharacterized protein YpuA (DUF1002 family)